MWFEIIKADEPNPAENRVKAAGAKLNENMRNRKTMIHLLPSKEKVTIKQAYEDYDAPEIPKEYWDYVDVKLKDDSGDLGVAYHTEFKRWITQHNPNHRAMYDMLDQNIKKLSPRAQWIYKPDQIGKDKFTHGDINNYKGFFWLASMNYEDSFLFNLDRNMAVHRGESGICVIKRGRMIPFEEYKFTKLETTEPDNPEDRPTGLLSQSLVSQGAKIHVDKETSADIETKKAKIVYDFLSSMELTAGGPNYGDMGPLPRWTKVSIGLGEQDPRSICVYSGGDASETPRGDKMNTGILAYNMNKVMWRSVEEQAVSMRGKRPEANTYPLEKTMITLNRKFPNWTGEDENQNKEVLDHLESENYFLKVTNLERFM